MAPFFNASTIFPRIRFLWKNNNKLKVIINELSLETTIFGPTSTEETNFENQKKELASIVR